MLVEKFFCVEGVEQVLEVNEEIYYPQFPGGETESHHKLHMLM